MSFSLSINASLVSHVLCNSPNTPEERPKVYLETKISASEAHVIWDLFRRVFYFFAEICGECCPIITLKESVGKFFGLACIKSYDYCNAFPAVCTALRIPSFPSSIQDLCSRSAWAQNRFAKSVSFVVSLPAYSSFTRSYSLGRSITVLDSPNPDSWWASSCNI